MLSQDMAGRADICLSKIASNQDHLERHLLQIPDSICLFLLALGRSL